LLICGRAIPITKQITAAKTLTKVMIVYSDQDLDDGVDVDACSDRKPAELSMGYVRTGWKGSARDARSKP
jgi:hypothetical protein